MKSLAKILQNFEEITVAKKGNKYYLADGTRKILEVTSKGIEILNIHYVNIEFFGNSDIIDIDILAKFISLIYYTDDVKYKDYNVRTKFHLVGNKLDDLQIEFIKDNICELELHYYFNLGVIYTPRMKIFGKEEMYFTESNAKNVFDILKSRGIDFE